MNNNRTPRKTTRKTSRTTPSKKPEIVCNTEDRIEKAIHSLIKILNASYEDYLSQKKDVINGLSFLNYCFGDPLIEQQSFIVATTNIYSETRIGNKMQGSGADDFDSYMTLLQGTMDKYLVDYSRHCAFSKKYKVANVDRVIFNPTMNENVKRIGAILKEMGIDHLRSWNFAFYDERTSATQRAPYIFKTNFELDVWGYVKLSNDKIVQFAIESDTIETADGCTDRISMSDYLKQFWLKKMNINLLRLDSKSNYKNEIARFILAIKGSHGRYVIHNGLDFDSMPKRIIDDPHNFMSDSLLAFYADYQYNHIRGIKYCTCTSAAKTASQRKPNLDSDDETGFLDECGYSDSDSSEEISNIGGDKSYELSSGINKDFFKRKFFFTK